MIHDLGLPPTSHSIDTNVPTHVPRPRHCGYCLLNLVTIPCRRLEADYPVHHIPTAGLWPPSQVTMRTHPSAVYRRSLIKKISPVPKLMRRGVGSLSLEHYKCHKKHSGFTFLTVSICPSYCTRISVVERRRAPPRCCVIFINSFCFAQVYSALIAEHPQLRPPSRLIFSYRLAKVLSKTFTAG